MPTLVLTRTEVAELLEPLPLLQAIRRGFMTSQGSSIPSQRARTVLPQQGSSAVALFPGLLPDIPAYSVKVHAKFPAETPAIRGLVHLFDAQTGKLLAVMDSGQLTALRTAAAGAVAADTLARIEARHVALIGAGVQSGYGLGLLGHVRPLHTVTVFDTAPLKTGPFVRHVAAHTDARLIPADSLAEAVAEADIVLAATWARDPFLYSDLLKPGAHVTTLGADEPGKAEVSAELLLRSSFFCDDAHLAVEMGAIGNVGLDESAIAGELGSVLAGKRAGRLGNEFTVYGGVGLPWMDLAAAWLTYQAALEAGVGTWLDFLA